jgi:predicted transcriptional regulator
MIEVAAPANGAAPASARERIAGELESEIAGLLRRERQLELELAEIKTDRKTFEQSLLRLRGEPLIKHSGRGRPPKAGESVRTTPARVGPEAIAEIEAMIRRFAADHDEFRQVDIRGTTSGPMSNSSKMATAFEQLRQDGVIRLARKDGNQKWFRLTESSRREKLVSDERIAEIEQLASELSADGEFGYEAVMSGANISHSGASYAMNELVERGVVETRRQGKGGAKLFRAINAEADAS